MSSSPAPAPPGDGASQGAHLLKGRVLHTRIAAFLGLPFLLTSQPAWDAWVLYCLVWLGFLSIAFCVLGRAYASAFVGGRKNAALVAEGPFSIVRNPLYVFSFIGVVGVGLAAGSLVWAAILALLFALYYPAVVAKEEAYLRGLFGADYDAYCARVPRWLPDLSLWRAPESVPLNPIFLFRTMRDGAWFFIAPPAFAAIRLLQGAGLWPAWLAVY
jgi:protein-S-isoprenylcysteine O-methyltransferase Ste14